MASVNNTSKTSNGSTESPSRMTAQQLRLQQMISMQHAHQDSMTQDYIRRSSSVGGTSAGTGSPPASPRQVGANKVGAGGNAVPSPASPNSPHWGRDMHPSSFLGPAGATPTASNLSAGPPPPPGRTAEYAKLLPGGEAQKQAYAQQPQSRNSDDQGIHYHSYPHQQPPPPSEVMKPLVEMKTEAPQRQELQLQGRGQPDRGEYYDAASHLPNYPTGYQSTGQVTQYGAGRFSLTTQSSRQSAQSEHQFHYGDPNHAFDNPYNNEFPFHHGRHPYDHDCLLSRCCRSFISGLLTAENLHRSLCFGAIDGILTGSGITAACMGLGLLSPVSNAAHRWGVVALSLAACTSDGICMAIGHIWSTYVMQHASIAERKEERRHFAQDRAASKARLVDMLLGRGMLKIDAMSVADTLEGYPDIFVSALVGDTGHALGTEGGTRLGSAENLHSAHGSGALGLAKAGSHGGSGHGIVNSEDGGRGHYPHHRHQVHYGQGRGLGGRSSIHYGSYGEFDEFRDDPDKHTMHVAMKDGWSEGAVMMLSFTVFSVLPSLTYLLTLDWFPQIPLDPQQNYYSGATSSTTVAVSIISGIMLLLGIWKSYFFDSNWVLFGVETVLVLLLCIMSAYFIGAGLNYSIGRHFDL